MVWKNSAQYLKKYHNLSHTDLFLDIDCTSPLKKFQTLRK